MTKQQDKKGFEYAIIDYKLIENTSLKSHDKAVYMVLCRFANLKTGECYPLRSTIAKLAGTSERQVTYSLQTLVKKKYITIKPWNKNKRKNVYIVHYFRDTNLKKSK